VRLVGFIVRIFVVGFKGRHKSRVTSSDDVQRNMNWKGCGGSGRGLV
jgi:hypothetical protein